MSPRADATLLLSQWLSPAFPVGAFAYSGGLESAIADGRVAPDTLGPWLTDIAEHGTGRSDAILIRCAARRTDPRPVDAFALSFASSAERRLEMQAQGAAFCAQLRATWGLTMPDLTYPVGFGHGVRALGLPVDLGVRMYLQAWLSNLVAAAQRLMPLGQTEGQRILAGLAPLCERLEAQTRGCGLRDISTQSFAADIAAMRHETLEPRIFRT